MAMRVTCVCGESGGEEDEEDEGGEEESRIVFLGQLRRPSLLLLAFRETGEERKSTQSLSNLTFNQASHPNFIKP